MNEKQLDLIKRFVEGTIDSNLYKMDDVEDGQDVAIGIDYIDDIEESLEYEGIAYSDDEKEEILSYFLEGMKKEYGEDNVYFGGHEQLVPVNGGFKTVHAQLAIVVYANEQVPEGGK
ncbi:hypothetical protein [Aneurinibacillus aneurinilyticus]|uniref:hypothetical protein n=1 Tax=Aneurinibacillus aneurinilyticus TaxID=1391 RepID=UPI0023F22D03|nr:hypothetical protein [Aneurinibacillus aneurinilyticus]